MKLLSLLFILSGSVWSGSFPEGYEDLGINLSANGDCRYSRNDLNNIQLHALFETNLKKRLSKLSDSELYVSEDWNCFFFKRAIERDSFQKLKSVNNIFDKTKAQDGVYLIEGTLKYIGFVKKKYKYDIIVKNGVITAKVKVYLKPSSEFKKWSRSFYQEHIDRIQEKLLEAEKSYNERSLDHLRFKFEIVNNINEAHFAPILTRKKSMGPYDYKWSTSWSEDDFAHEVGHMLGLDDEYDNIGSRSLKFAKSIFLSKEERVKIQEDSFMEFYRHIKSIRCDITSIMCAAEFGTIKKRHVYLVFNRVFN